VSRARGNWAAEEAFSSAALSCFAAGADALDALCRHLHERFSVAEFMVQPSARNPRAIRAYEKAGFRRLDLPIEEARSLWGPSDYADSVYMVRAIPPEGGGEDPS
jgi:RimJ/RimL family protein N-acetyltransferase